MKPNVQSLSTVKPKCGEWNELPVFGGSKQPQGAITLEHLSRLVDHNTPASIPDFLKQSERIFRELLILIRESDNGAKTSPSCSWTAEYAAKLTKQLEELERLHGDSVIEELSDDLLKVVLKYQDGAGREHRLRLKLSPETFPQEKPDCSTNLPIKRGWQPSWRIAPQTDSDDGSRPTKRYKVDPNSKESGAMAERTTEHGLSGLYADFICQVDKYQQLWNELDGLDASTWVLEPSTQHPDRSISERRIAVMEGTSVVISLDPNTPRSPPLTIRWVGADTAKLKERLEQHLASRDFNTNWSMNRSVKENLERGLGIQLPSAPADAGEASPTVDCGICYSQDLPTENGSSEFPDTVCDNGPCARHYHETCLRDWLLSLPSSRKSFDRIIGTCPYCNEPISATMRQTP